MVAPQGGVYLGGQKIFTIGVQGKTNPKSNFRKYWVDTIKQLVKLVPNSEKMNSPKELMNELLYMRTNSKYEGPSIKAILNSVGPVIDNPLHTIIEGANDRTKALGDTLFDSYVDYIEKNASTVDEDRKAVDFMKESTNLNLQDREPEVSEEDVKSYSIMSEQEGVSIFGKEQVEKIRNSGLHVEFYKLRHDINGNRFYNPVMTISFVGAKAKGFA